MLPGEISTRGWKSVVQVRSSAELLEKSIARYQSRAIETAQVIEELIALARDIRQAEQRGEQLGLTDDEVAFYDALQVNPGAPGRKAQRRASEKQPRRDGTPGTGSRSQSFAPRL